MKQYELMVIVDPNIGENGAKKRLDEIRKLLKDMKGEIFYEDIWGTRDLAYPVKKRDKGYYAVLDFNLDNSSELQEMERTLTLENEVLRHMIITLPKGYEPKSYLNTEDEKEPQKEAEKKAEPAGHRKDARQIGTIKKENKKDAAGPSMEEVDAKLKSIIDNPDINF